MADDDIVSSVSLEGDDQVNAQLEKVGDTGQKTFEKISTSATEAVGPMGAVDAMARRLGVTMEEAQRRIDANNKSLGGAAPAAGGAGAAFTQFEEDVRSAGQGANAASVDFKGMSSTLRTLARATHIPGLSQLAGSLRVLGRIGAAAVPVLLLTALEQIASSAAHAASAMQDLALKGAQTSAEFQQISAFGAGAGVSIEKMGEAVVGLNGLFKEAAENAQKNAEKTSQLKDQMRQLEAQATQLAQRYRELEQAGVKSFEKQAEAARKFQREMQSLDQEFAKLARDRRKLSGQAETAEEKHAREKEELDQRELDLIEKQFEAIEKRRQEERNFRQEEEKRAQQQSLLLDQEEANRKKMQETKKALSDAASEASRTGNAVEKLGVSVLDSNGKVRKFNEEGLKDLADAFQRLPDGAEKTKIASELVAAGLDRALLPALNRGREGVDAFIAEGKKIAPGFTEAQEAIGDKFVESANKFTLALKNLRDQAGIELAPGFTQFFDNMRDRITNAIPFVQQLSKVFGTLIGLTKNLTLQPSPIVAAIQLIKGAVTDLNLGWSTIPKIAKAEFEFLKSVVSTVWDFIKTTFNDGVTFLKSIKVGDVLAEAWRLIKIGVGLLWDFVKEKFNEGVKFLKSIKVGDVLAFVWDLVKQGVSALWDFVKGKFNEGIQFLKSINVGDVLNAAWELIKQGVSALWEFIKQKFAEGVTAIQKLLPEDPLAALWELVKEGAGKLWEFIVQKFKEGAEAAWQFVKDKANDALTWVNQKVDESLGKLKELWAFVKQVGAAFASLFGGGATTPATPGVPGLAGGGQVRGKGTSTSDSILAFLSNEEFVMKAAAVKKYGVGLLSRLNNMQIPKTAFGLDGLASSLNVRARAQSFIPGFASGGLVGAATSGRPLVLKIGQESFNLRTHDEDTAERVTRYAIRRATQSAGRKPSSWD